MSKSHYNAGKMFAEHLDVETCRNGNNYQVSISWGENYYETDPYSKKEYALSEAKGYLDGLEIKLKTALDDIGKQLEEVGENY